MAQFVDRAWCHAQGIEVQVAWEELDDGVVVNPTCSLQFTCSRHLKPATPPAEPGMEPTYACLLLKANA